MKKQFILIAITLLLTLTAGLSANSSYSTSPPPTLFERLDEAGEVIVGTVAQVDVVTLPNTDQYMTTVVELSNAMYIDGTGIHPLDTPIYIYSQTDTYGNNMIGVRSIFLMQYINGRHNPINEFIEQEDNSLLVTGFKGRGGTVQRVKRDGQIEFRPPYHSCKVKNPLFRVKEYECKYLGETITVAKPPDTEAPIQLDELTTIIAEYLTGSRVTSSEMLAQLGRRMSLEKIMDAYLSYHEVLDKVFTDASKTAPLHQNLLDDINQRNQARGSNVVLENDPQLVEYYAKLESEQKARLAAERKVAEKEMAEEQALAEERRKQNRLIEIAAEGHPIPLNQADASMSSDLELLPNCSQLTNSPDFPIKGDTYYIGNCKYTNPIQVCTFKTDKLDTTLDCIKPEDYSGGVITEPRGLPFNPASVPWTEEEIVILFHGAGMSAEEISSLRQPPGAPALFKGIQPTMWNLYLRQVERIPDTVPKQLQ